MSKKRGEDSMKSNNIQETNNTSDIGKLRKINRISFLSMIFFQMAIIAVFECNAEAGDYQEVKEACEGNLIYMVSFYGLLITLLVSVLAWLIKGIQAQRAIIIAKYSTISFLAGQTVMIIEWFTDWYIHDDIFYWVSLWILIASIPIMIASWAMVIKDKQNKKKNKPATDIFKSFFKLNGIGIIVTASASLLNLAIAEGWDELLGYLALTYVVPVLVVLEVLCLIVIIKRKK